MRCLLKGVNQAAIKISQVGPTIGAYIRGVFVGLSRFTIPCGYMPGSTDTSIVLRKGRLNTSGIGHLDKGV
jgi:hypothetical protein